MSNITEEQIYEVLGISANEQESADPAPDASYEGTNEQEVAAPAETDTLTDNIEDDDTAPADTGDDEKPELTPEERRENAARRREQEKQSAIAEAVRKALDEEREKSKAQMTDFFSQAQLNNTLTNTPITNMDEFNEWRKTFEKTKLENDLKAGTLTPDTLNKVISDNPALKEMQDYIRRNKEEQRQKEIAAAQARVNADIAEIQKLDPSVKNIDDLVKMPSYNEFYEYVKRGNTLADAYYLANRERLQSAAATAAKQQAMSNARSKEHLTSTSPRGGIAASVPPDEMALFRELNPNATEAEIQAYYQKFKK